MRFAITRKMKAIYRNDHLLNSEGEENTTESKHTNRMKAVDFLFIGTVLSVGESNANMFGESSFQSLSCTEKRNVTIIIDDLHHRGTIKELKLLNVYLKPMIRNEACFNINLYDYEEDRVIRLKENTSFNHLYSCFASDDWKINYGSGFGRKINFVERLSKDGPTAVNHAIETLVLMQRRNGFGNYMAQHIEILQKHQKWDVILFCFHFCSAVHPRLISVLPFHRMISRF